jgi:hypothetical protein
VLWVFVLKPAELLQPMLLQSIAEEEEEEEEEDPLRPSLALRASLSKSELGKYEPPIPER